jgi:Tfp pilus assembly protein PilV
MAGNQLILQTRLKASSILEVLISMVLILVVFGLAMMISANVLRSSLTVKKIEARALLQQALIVAEQDKAVATRTYVVGDFKIEQDLTDYPGHPGLTQIRLSAVDVNEDTVAQVQKVIIAP